VTAAQSRHAPSQPAASIPEGFRRSVAGGWRVTGPSPCPSIRALSPGFPAYWRWMVARDGRARAARHGPPATATAPPPPSSRAWTRRSASMRSSPALAAGHAIRSAARAPRREHPAGHPTGADVRACGAASACTPHRTPSACPAPTTPARTTVCTPCIVSADPWRKTIRHAPPRRARVDGHADPGKLDAYSPGHDGLMGSWPPPCKAYGRSISSRSAGRRPHRGDALGQQ
jgi:hypothetical protein